ncbi:hypothetical protein E2C01_042729 [Portunus trituberculatus]|uniref:Uncharacterized protein n=1 Tax=Portunus trituberculatus TaxID=210409 RepID=A0A5B7FVF8_PORTR|nr:hypothetical protein [Portunus trituberculatus]
MKSATPSLAGSPHLVSVKAMFSTTVFFWSGFVPRTRVPGGAPDGRTESPAVAIVSPAIPKAQVGSEFGKSSTIQDFSNSPINYTCY